MQTVNFIHFLTLYLLTILVTVESRCSKANPTAKRKFRNSEKLSHSTAIGVRTPSIYCIAGDFLTFFAKF